MAERAAPPPLPAPFSGALPQYVRHPVPCPLQPPPQNVVHLWCFPLPGIEATEHALEILSPAERERYDAMRAPRARQQFAACRIALRGLLVEYLGGLPSDFVVPCTPGEKPCLPEPAPLAFSYSHAGAHVALAFVASGMVGVDLEVPDPRRDIAGIAQRYFQPEEQHYCGEAGSPGTAMERFLRVWTAKEALLKASGEGLRGLRRVSLRDVGERGLQLHAWGLPKGAGVVSLAVPEGSEIRTFHGYGAGEGDFPSSARP